MFTLDTFTHILLFLYDFYTMEKMSGQQIPIKGPFIKFAENAGNNQETEKVKSGLVSQGLVALLTITTLFTS